MDEESTEGPVPAAVVERALARLGDAGDLLHDVLAPQERGLGPGALPGESWHMLGEALEALGRAERLLRVGLARPSGGTPWPALLRFPGSGSTRVIALHEPDQGAHGRGSQVA